MTPLKDAPEVVELADTLGVGGSGDPVAAVVRLCRSRLDGWVAEAGGVATVADLERVVTQRLQMVFEEVWADEDFARIAEKYARGKKDPVFAAMRLKFNDPANPTYGALVKRKNVGPESPDRYVAVIDCRGEKAHRRFFTRWHEIAHRLTTDADPDEPEYRSAHDPVERLMDEIAGRIGYYDPLFDPVFKAAGGNLGRLTFGTVQAVIDGGFPEASFQATLFACLRRTDSPVVYVQAALGHKADEERELQRYASLLFEDCEPEAKLRAVEVVPNAAAQKDKRLFIAPNMRVPEASVIHRLFRAGASSELSGRENLGTWEHSGGKKRLADCEVWVEARKLKAVVIALVQPAH